MKRIAFVVNSDYSIWELEDYLDANLNLTVEKRVKLGVPSAGTLRRKGLHPVRQADWCESKTKTKIKPMENEMVIISNLYRIH
ncbi:hypothetical protein AVEN_47760-1 [Araneus ventricosus]|uniref:Uncharacterized protein n=1 Tax=Araneus ventricosus TaxID=182803 RepID=A0A4Y2J4H6_ARAVE|nr:hypothetical protein AVEN_47760-1 [Araneus ventricosus]